MDILIIYLPDLKYYDDDLAFKYSGVKNYFENATSAIKEMYNQSRKPSSGRKRNDEKGLLIRHWYYQITWQNSKDVLKWINDNIDKRGFVSVMAQYFPTNRAKEFPEINRKLTKEEYEEIEKLLILIRFR